MSDHLPSFSRRAFLRNAGVIMSLPALESFGFKAFAAAKPLAAPTRMAFLYIPNGVNVAQWKVTGEGRDYALSPTLSGLASYKQDISVVSNLAHFKAFSNGDGGGDHARATATFLTGCQAKKTAGADIKIGVSVDQIVAEKIGSQTRLASLELSTDGERVSGKCDSGYSCAYQFNLAWRNETMPMTPEMDPRLVFERLFGVSAAGNTEAGRRRKRFQGSVLDFVLSDAKSLSRKVSAADNRKLDEYFAAVRDIEERIQKAEKLATHLPEGVVVPTAIPTKAKDHIRLMFDLLALAFQTDTTRISTFLMAHDGSNRSFPEIGVPDSHHGISHHQGDPAKLEKIAKIDQFYVEQFGYFLGKLKSIKEGAGNLLDNSMIVYGGGISDGNRHDHSHLPIVLAGHGGGKLHAGQHLVAPDNTPMTNLYLALMDRMGVHAERVGDSTGVLQGI